MYKKTKERIQKIFSGNERSVAVKKNIFYSLVIRFISIFVSFIIVPVTIGYVSAELYGVWLALASIITWLAFMDIGFTQGLKNRLTEAIAVENWERGRQLISTTYMMMLAIFIPVGILLVFLVPLVDWCSLLNLSYAYEKEVSNVIVVVLVFACLQMIVNVLVSVVAAFQKVALSNSFFVIGNLLSLIVIIILTKTCPPSLLYLSITLCSMPVLVTLVASIILYNGIFRRVAPSFSEVNFSLIRDLFGLGYKFFIINVQVLVLYQSTNMLISYVSSPLMVTSYNLAYKYMNLAMMMFSIITAPLWPAYTDAYAKKDFEWMKNMRKKMQRIFSCSVMLAIIMVIISPVFYRLWIGQRAEVPFEMTLLVACYVIVYCWNSLNGTLVVGMGKLAIQTRISIVGMLFHIPMALFLSKYISAYGIITSLLIVTLFYAVITNYQVNIIIGRKAKGIWIK
jgi:O-antigen/teichoic acid export membrane protein